MWILTWLWNRGPALYLRSHGCLPSSLHVFCGTGEGLWPCSSRCPVTSTVGLWGAGMRLKIWATEMSIRGCPDSARNKETTAWSKTAAAYWKKPVEVIRAPLTGSVPGMSNWEETSRQIIFRSVWKWMDAFCILQVHVVSQRKRESKMSHFWMNCK